MRKNLLSFILGVIVMAGSNLETRAQSVLVYYWDFNNYTPLYTSATAGVSIYANIPADYAVTGLDTSKARFFDRTIPGTSAAFSSYCDVTSDATDTVNARIIGGSLITPGNCFRARNPDDSLELLIYMPTTGYKNLQIKYGCELSSYTSGDSVNVFSYSVDSGTTWITSGAGLSEWVDSGSLTFKLISVHVNDTNAYNNGKFVFRINLVGRNSGTGGNNRIDNISLDGDSLAAVVDTAHNNAVSPVNGITVNYSLFPNPATNNLTINATIDGEKNVEIYNLFGQKVSTEFLAGKTMNLDIASLSAGNYIVRIQDKNTGDTGNLKFVKQ